MKTKLKFTLNALVLTMILIAAYAITARAQSSATTSQKTAAGTANVTTAGSLGPVVGSGTAGQLTKWTGFSGSTSAVGDSTITEDKFGNVGIGTTTPTSKLTVQGPIESVLGGFKFPDGTTQITAFDPNLVVRSLNGLRGDLTLAAGQNITVTPSGGNTLTIAAPNALTSVFHNATLAGNGTAASPLSIADGGVGTLQLANSGVTAAKIASGQIVKGLNGLTDDVQLVAGSGITLTPVGNMLTIASAASDPERNAFQATRNIGVGDGENRTSATVSVPAGKRLVIEYVTMSTPGDDADMLFLDFSTQVAGISVVHRISLVDNGGRVDRLVRIYSDSDVTITVGKEPSGGVETFVTISGHLVDLP